MGVGDIRVTAGEQSTTVLIAEPADPFLYVRYKNFAAGASFNGRIPFNNTVSPNQLDNVLGTQDDIIRATAFLYANGRDQP